MQPAEPGPGLCDPGPFACRLRRPCGPTRSGLHYRACRHVPAPRRPGGTMLPHDPPAADPALDPRLAAVRERVRQAAERAGRAADEVRLVGASKTVAAER